MSRDQVIKLRVAEVGPLYRGIMERAYSGTASPRQAIKAMCLSCVGFDREAVASCTGYSCPLWPYRYNAPPEKTGSSGPRNDAENGRSSGPTERGDAIQNARNAEAAE